MDKKYSLGSQTAKEGFRNERDVAKRFKSWKTDKYACQWLEAMNYNLNEIEKVESIIIHGEKTDVQAQVTIYMKKSIGIENISVKLVSNVKSGFNQVDKRWVDAYTKMWNMPKEVVKSLKRYTGETIPNRKNLKDIRRINFNEMSDIERNRVIKFFIKNKFLVIADIFKGRGKLSASWILVIAKKGKKYQWALKDINVAMNVFGAGEIKVTKQGVLKIGRITMQRKGGDRGRKTASMLQFKANPLELLHS